MKVGYIRVSTLEQNEARQEVLMEQLGVDKIYLNIPRERYHRSTVGYRQSMNQYRESAGGYHRYNPVISAANRGTLLLLHRFNFPHIQLSCEHDLHVVDDSVQNCIRMNSAAESGMPVLHPILRTEYRGRLVIPSFDQLK